MITVLLSGDSGKRLWPLSNGARSKQFIKCLKKEDGSYESMLQRIHRQIQKEVPSSRMVIVTSKPQVSAVVNQLGDDTSICVEPVHKGIFASVCLTASWLKQVQNVAEEEIVAFCPSDTFVSEGYYQMLSAMETAVCKEDFQAAMSAVTPTYPSAKYAYVMTAQQGKHQVLSEYISRTAEDAAAEWIQKGALWNAGIYVGTLGFFLKLCQKMFPFEDHDDLYQQFHGIPEYDLGSVLYQNHVKTCVISYQEDWKTLGTWNTLTEAMEDSVVGNALFDDHCDNVHVVNELDVPVLCMGLSDVVISASAEGILVSDKTHSSYISPYVEQIDQRIMFADKSWGSYRVLDVEEESMTIKVTLNPGHSMNYHSHERRDEVWTVIGGEGYTVVDGMEQPVKAGDVITMEAGCRHTIVAKTKLHLIEVQLGTEISVNDKKKYELEI